MRINFIIDGRRPVVQPMRTGRVRDVVMMAAGGYFIGGMAGLSSVSIQYAWRRNVDVLTWRLA